MFNLSQKPEADAIEVIIGPRTRFSGNIECDTSVRIDGSFEGGHIETPANVILSKNSRVECNIIAKTVSIHGAYMGIVQADRVELLGGSQIHGEIYVNSFFMDQGVLLSAAINVQGEPMDHALLMPIQKPAYKPVQEATMALNSPATMPIMTLHEGEGEVFELQELTDQEIDMMVHPSKLEGGQEEIPTRLIRQPTLLRYVKNKRGSILRAE